jgi:CRISPR-associated protein Cas1
MPERPDDLVPARMLNEFAYCPRLMYLEWTDGLFADSADTVEGRFVHRRVDEAGGDLPPAGPQPDEARIHARSVMLSDPEHGLIARIDLVESAGGAVSPVDYKRGRPPDLPERSWEPERVQLCAQALVLRANGYRCTEGVLYFAEARERVTVPITDDLVARTLQLLVEARRVAAQPEPPAPLVQSPKCPRCSLVGICLPDETNLVARPEDLPRVPRGDVRLLYPARPDATPLYVTEPGARVGRSGERLVVRADDRILADVRMIDVSELAVFGNVQVSTQAIQELAQRECPVTYFSGGGYFYAILHGMPARTAHLRIRQHAVAADGPASLPLARQIVRGKVLNQRTLLRRNARDLPERVVPELRRLALAALRARSREALLGIEGAAANVYFGHFHRMITRELDTFHFAERNRRPPRDATNALLSLGYAMLTKDLTVTCLAVGLEPYVGVFHQPGRGRPAMALDLMEEFRPLLVDSVVINAINRGLLGPSDFVARAGAVALTPAGRRRFIEAYEQRMATLITHPVFGYQVSYRRALEVQVRLFARALRGEVPRYMPFLVR